MIKVFEKQQEAVVAIMEVPKERTQRYGICAGQWDNDREMRVKRMVEKPHPKVAPSNFGIVEQHVATADIFELLEETPPGKGGENSTHRCTTHACSDE